MKLFSVKKRGHETKWVHAASPKNAILKCFPNSDPVPCGKTSGWTYHVICHCTWAGGSKEYFYKEENGDT